MAQGWENIILNSNAFEFMSQKMGFRCNSSRVTPTSGNIDGSRLVVQDYTLRRCIQPALQSLLTKISLYLCVASTTAAAALKSAIEINESESNELLAMLKLTEISTKVGRRKYRDAQVLGDSTNDFNSMIQS
jgi:hypothetical protein